MSAGAGGPLRVLIVEDEAHLARGLKLNLELEGFEATIAGSGREAAAHLLGPAFDAILLDVQLPDVSGFELCQRLRDGGDHTPVIMLTVRVAAEDRVRGLEVGADDYVPKPFAMAELLARLRAVLRRQGWERAQAQAAPADLARYPELRFLNRFWLLPPVSLALAVFAIWGWSGLVVGFLWSTVALWHGIFTINSLSHLWGTRTFATADHSRNNALLALITLGEGWHNNHHHYMLSTRQGFRWWQFDITFYVLKVMSWFHLVWDLREPPPELKRAQPKP